MPIIYTRYGLVNPLGLPRQLNRLVFTVLGRLFRLKLGRIVDASQVWFVFPKFNRDG
ncbi:hypothetical protein [Candidatus Leptofilum sp.]|uniref:hypothetical protein n=1 Tax=Candidatus Leptofilum sp. TaxID=3241576 RepID=UPI003B59CEDA